MPAIGHGTEICTSTTRPSTAVEGMMIYETDTNKILVNSSATSTPSWVEVNDLDSTNALSTSGQTKLDGKFDTSKIKTGRYAGSANTGSATVTYPSAFSNNNITVVTTGQRGSQDNPIDVWLTASSSTGFTFEVRNSSGAFPTGTYTIHWIAIQD